MITSKEKIKKAEAFLSSFKTGDLIWIEKENLISSSEFPFCKVFVILNKIGKHRKH